MKLRRVETGGGAARVELWAPQGWVPVTAAAARISSFNQGIADDVVALLALPLPERERLAEAARDVAPADDDARPILPFAPRSFRDFMLYESTCHRCGARFRAPLHARPRAGRCRLRGRDAPHLPRAQAARALAPPAHLLHGQPPDLRGRRRRHRDAVLHARARLRAGDRLRPRASAARCDAA